MPSSMLTALNRSPARLFGFWKGRGGRPDAGLSWATLRVRVFRWGARPRLHAPGTLLAASRFALVALVAGLVAGAAGTVAARGAHASRAVRSYSTKGTLPLRTSLFDPYSFVGNSGAFSVAQATGATYVRLLFNWSSVAPKDRPPGFVASDESSPGYSWHELDEEVTAAERAGVTPILDVYSAPNWAFAVRPKGTRGGTPNAKDLGQFATAL